MAGVLTVTARLAVERVEATEAAVMAVAKVVAATAVAAMAVAAMAEEGTVAEATAVGLGEEATATEETAAEETAAVVRVAEVTVAEATAAVTAAVERVAVEKAMETRSRREPRRGSGCERPLAERSSRTSLPPHRSCTLLDQLRREQRDRLHTETRWRSCSPLRTGRSRFERVTSGLGSSRTDCRGPRG